MSDKRPLSERAREVALKRYLTENDAVVMHEMNKMHAALESRLAELEKNCVLIPHRRQAPPEAE